MPALASADAFLKRHRIWVVSITVLIVLAGLPAHVAASALGLVAFGFLGMYIARPAVRGKGLGFQTWRAGMERMACSLFAARARRQGFVDWLAAHEWIFKTRE